MSEKQKRDSVAAWDAFAERCKEPPVESKAAKVTVKPAAKKKGKK